VLVNTAVRNANMSVRKKRSEVIRVTACRKRGCDRHQSANESCLLDKSIQTSVLLRLLAKSHSEVF
jgi:hypothetical protein